MPAEPPAVQQPDHPLHAQTTYELHAYRLQLENAVAFFSKQDPVPPVCSELRGKLTEVLTEQSERERIAAHAHP